MKKGFLAVEYAVLIAIIVAALIAMQGYIRKAISGRWRESTDSIGFGMQYEPGVTTIEDANKIDKDKFHDAVLEEK